MRTEYREVTFKQEVYIAEDGREFTDEDDCEAYDIKLIENSLKFYDNSYEKSDVDSCVYFHAITEEDVERAIKVCEYYGITREGLYKPGLYMFADTLYRKEAWVNLDEVIFHIRGGVEK